MCSIMGYCGSGAAFGTVSGSVLKEPFREVRTTAGLWIPETASSPFTGLRLWGLRPRACSPSSLTEATPSATASFTASRSSASCLRKRATPSKATATARFSSRCTASTARICSPCLTRNSPVLSTTQSPASISRPETPSEYVPFITVLTSVV